MKKHSRSCRTVLMVLVALALVCQSGLLRGAAPPVYVTLWFDTEDYILPQDDDATKRLAGMLTRLGVRATFKIVGEKARVLEQRGRTDVIAALQQHDIGYHSNTHSQQPTIAVYLQHAGWDEGVAEFTRREQQGVGDIQRIFGVTPVAYGQPGSAWAPQTYPALRAFGIHVYLDEADHVGIDDQPFYYGGLLNVFKMRSTLVRMPLEGGASLDEGKAAFTRAADALRARGGGTISIYYHPNEWVQTEFWDAVNFRRGANPPRHEWKRPGTRPAAETERAFADFEQFVQFMKAQDGVRFVTATDLAGLYADRARTRPYDRGDLLDIARGARGEISFRTFDTYALSPADQFALLTAAAATLVDGKPLVPAAPALLDGPSRPFGPSIGVTRSRSYRGAAFADAVRDAAAFVARNKRIPDEIWMGAENLSPADYLATLAGAFEDLVASGRMPASVTRVEGRFTADRYVADDSPTLWGWPIFPEGFHAPRIMELARLQAWTLKPAMLRAGK
ncbi:MAG: polysaccharide deacetylase family protein [Acidobacteria bacterium]|nr:polysaccharide deacetylase family protein [Acidobacteriota bacterium]